jgi:ABC-2 type transport system permease protein
VGDGVDVLAERDGGRVGSTLPSPWNEVSHANPIFYLVQAVRYGFLGTSDVPVGIALGITAALAAITVAWSSWLFHSGRRLKP